MSTSPTEWVMAFASVATGAFVGWQAYTLNRSISAPFQVNLQDRQIAACAEAIKATEAYVAGLTSGAAAQFKKFDLGSATTFAAPTVAQPQTTQAAQIALNAFSESVAASEKRQEDFRRAIAELKVYASDETAAKIDAVVAQANSAGSFTTFALTQTDADGSVTAKIETAFSDIRDRCRRLMLGEERGLI